MTVTSQASGGASDNSDAFAPPGSAPVGPLLPEHTASLHNDPALELTKVDARHLVRGES